MSLTLIDPLRPQWESGNLLGRWHDRSTRKLEGYLNEIVVSMLTGAAIVRHNRVAAEAAERQRQERHEAYLLEQERLRREAQVDAFIESKADELSKLQKILSFRDYISKQRSAPTSPEEDAILEATNEMVERLQHKLSPEALRQAVRLSD